MKQKEQQFIIGRGKTCDVIIADKSISRRHAALIVQDAGKLMLIDCNSANGTVLLRAGVARRIHQEAVSLADIIQMGDVQITVLELLEALRHPAVSAPTDRKKPSAKNTHGTDTLVRGTQLERCACGAIKIKDGLCKVCACSLA